jgi:Flp pilus assembly pilin Flp
MQQFLYNLWREEAAQDLIEYSLLICFFAIACFAFLGGGTPAVSKIWQVNGNHLDQANAAAAAGS